MRSTCRTRADRSVQVFHPATIQQGPRAQDPVQSGKNDKRSVQSAQKVERMGNRDQTSSECLSRSKSVLGPIVQQLLKPCQTGTQSVATKKRRTNVDNEETSLIWSVCDSSAYCSLRTAYFGFQGRYSTGSIWQNALPWRPAVCTVDLPPVGPCAHIFRLSWRDSAPTCNITPSAWPHSHVFATIRECP